MADSCVYCFRFGYVLLFSVCAQGQMSHVGAVDVCGKRASGVRHQDAHTPKRSDRGDFSLNGSFHSWQGRRASVEP